MDESARVPLIVAAPGMKAGVSTAALPGRESVYTIVMRGATKTGRALHTPNFTYLEWPDGNQQLYAAADPHEFINLAKEPRYAETLAAMKQSLAKRRAEIGLDDSTLIRRKP